MPAAISTKTIWNGLVSFVQDHSEMVAPQTLWTPRLLTIHRGPRSGGWIETIAPLIVIDLLREEEQDEAAQRDTHRYSQYYQWLLIGRGATPEAADDMALDLNDTINTMWRGDGCYFGQESNGVAGSIFTPGGWDLQERSDPLISVWVKNLKVEVYKP